MFRFRNKVVEQASLAIGSSRGSRVVSLLQRQQTNPSARRWFSVHETDQINESSNLPGLTDAQRAKIGKNDHRLRNTYKVFEATLTGD